MSPAQSLERAQHRFPTLRSKAAHRRRAPARHRASDDLCKDQPYTYDQTENIEDYMHARYYSPNLGRFLSVDPVGGRIGSSQSWNRYAYVRNNPIRSTDPTGKQTVPEYWTVPNLPTSPGLSDLLDSVSGLTNKLDGGTTRPTAEQISKFLEAADRPDKNRYTRAGRELQKHSQRGSDTFKGSSQKPSDLNPEGRGYVEDIVNDPDSIAIERTRIDHGEQVPVVEVLRPDGSGVMFDKVEDEDGNVSYEMYSFREPNNPASD